MQNIAPNHYATLGLDRQCTSEQIRAAYRLLAKQHHPDRHSGSAEAVAQTQALNAAHEMLSDSARRLAYDQELDGVTKSAAQARRGKIKNNVFQDVNLRIEDFLRGTSREVRVNDPANSNGVEVYQLVIPPNTPPGARFRLPRTEPFASGFVQVRTRVLPSFRFKVRGSDLRCDLRIKPERATQGGVEMIPGVTGGTLRVQIPRGVGRNEVLRIPGEGLPKLRGGRGDLLVRITYRVEVVVSRRSSR